MDTTFYFLTCSKQDSRRPDDWVPTSKKTLKTAKPHYCVLEDSTKKTACLTKYQRQVRELLESWKEVQTVESHRQWLSEREGQQPEQCGRLGPGQSSERVGARSPLFPPLISPLLHLSCEPSLPCEWVEVFKEIYSFPLYRPLLHSKPY